jgi:hypothetical protein
MDQTNKLASLIGSEAMLGSGMAKKAAEVIKSRPYQLHVQESKAMGVPPLSPQQFLEMMQGQR